MIGKKRIIWLEVSDSNPQDIKTLIENKKFLSQEDNFKVLSMVKSSHSFFFRLELNWLYSSYKFNFNGLGWPSLNYRLKHEKHEFQEVNGGTEPDLSRYLADGCITVNDNGKSYHFRDCHQHYLITCSNYTFSFTKTLK